jgi:hypothetical protein
MPIRGFRARDLALLVGTLLILFASSACTVTVEEAKPSPTAVAQRSSMSSGISALPEIDAAISAIDFDPPLRSDTLLRSQRPVKLLAAVENSGTTALYDLTVEAFLASEGSGVTIQDRVRVEKLAPGETRVVEFQQMASISTLPKSSSYRIWVTVGGRQPDANLRNNLREVIVRVSDY